MDRYHRNNRVCDFYYYMAEKKITPSFDAMKVMKKVLFAVGFNTLCLALKKPPPSGSS